MANDYRLDYITAVLPVHSPNLGHCEAPHGVLYFSSLRRQEGPGRDMDSTQQPARARAEEDYTRAARAASLRNLWTALTGRSNNLIAFEDLKRTLGFSSQHYQGLEPVPLDKIVGSLGRSRDFDRVFMPTQTHSRGKWVSVDSAYLRGVRLPPVSLYKVGDAYFVVDGHHRVSVARQKGQVFIDAEVIEVQSRVPVTADLRVEDLDILGAYREFLEKTKLDQLRPEQDVDLTMPGDYVKLIDHIRMHKYFVETGESREMDWEEAVVHWYDNVYMPVIEAIRENNLLEGFPGHTEGDLYFWIIEHAYYLSQELGQQVSSWQAAKHFLEQFSSRPNYLFKRFWRRLRHKLIPSALDPGPPPGTWREERLEPLDRVHLFREILVTLTGADTGWLALSQAVEIAKREESNLRGLHVLTSDSEEARVHGEAVLREFEQRTHGLNLETSATIVQGDVVRNIVDRARWADLVVINQRSERGRTAERPLGSVFQSVVTQAPSPILAVPGNEITSLHNVLLAYDGSPKAREALFIFRHILYCWEASGTILMAASAHTNREMLADARTYVEDANEGRVNTVRVKTVFEEAGPHEAIMSFASAEGTDLLLMGGYGYRPLVKAFVGSTVDRILRVAWFPIIICH